MKKILLLAFICYISVAAKAQRPDTSGKVKQDTDVYYAIDQAPEFPGGLSQMYLFIKQNIQIENWGKPGNVVLTFVVEKDGRLTNISVTKSLAPRYDAEAIRIIKLSPNWHPGKLKSRPVRAKYTLPVRFD
jgi:TonB family protein